MSQSHEHWELEFLPQLADVTSIEAGELQLNVDELPEHMVTVAELVNPENKKKCL